MKTLRQWTARRSGDAITIHGVDESGTAVRIKVTEIVGDQAEGDQQGDQRIAPSATGAEGELYRLL